MNISLLDYFNGFNNSFSYSDNSYASDEIASDNKQNSFPFDGSMYSNEASQYFLENTRIEDSVIYSFEHSHKFFCVFFKGREHTLHVSIQLCSIV